MASKVVISKFARRLGRSTDVVLERLELLGYADYKSGNQRIPLSVARELRELFEEEEAMLGGAGGKPTAPREALEGTTGPPGVERDGGGAGAHPIEGSEFFHQAMRAAGVKPLPREEPPAPRKKKRRKKKRVLRGGTDPLEPKAVPKPSSPADGGPPPSLPHEPPAHPAGGEVRAEASAVSPLRKAGAPKAAEPSRPPSFSDGDTHSDGGTDSVKFAGNQAKQEQRARRQLARQQEARQQERIESLQAQVHDLQQELQRVVAEREEAQEALERTRSTGLQPPSPEGFEGLFACFHERGVRGVDELASALRHLLREHLLDNHLSLLHVEQPGRFRAVLRDRLCLSCHQEGCEPPPGVVALRVPPSRCELCTGQGGTKVLRRFSDACLLLGITQVLFVGGAPRCLKWIRDGVDERLRVRTHAVSGNGVQVRLGDDLPWCQVVVAWTGSAGLAPSPEALPEGRALRVVTDAPTIGRALWEVAGQVDTFDPLQVPAPPGEGSP